MLSFLLLIGIFIVVGLFVNSIMNSFSRKDKKNPIHAAFMIIFAPIIGVIALLSALIKKL